VLVSIGNLTVTMVYYLLSINYSRSAPNEHPFNGLFSRQHGLQEAQLSPSDRAMRLVSSNLTNYHATVQKLLIRQVLTKPMV